MKKVTLIALVISISLLIWVFWPASPTPPRQDDTEKGYFTITNDSTKAIDIDIAEPRANNTMPVYWVRYFESPEDYHSYKQEVEALLSEPIEDAGNDLLPIVDFGFGYIFGQVDADWATKPSLYPLCVKFDAEIPEWYIPEFKSLLGARLLRMNNEVCEMCLREDLSVFRYMWEEGLTDYERERN